MVEVTGAYSMQRQCWRMQHYHRTVTFYCTSRPVPMKIWRLIAIKDEMISWFRSIDWFYDPEAHFCSTIKSNLFTK